MNPVSPDARTWRRSVSQGWLLQLSRTSTIVSLLHKQPELFADMMERRQRYSHYLPLYHNYSRTTSQAASFSKDGTRSPRGARASSSLQSAKRRSTMNSRDAAYDEEQIRRAIEASKGEKSGESVDGGIRRGKRSRSDSEE